MAYLFAKKRKANIVKTSEEEDNSNPDQNIDVVENNDVIIQNSSTDSEPSSPELLSPGNSPGEAATSSSSRGTFGLRSFLYDYWSQYRETKQNSGEKYHPLTSISDQDILISSADLMDLTLEPNSSPEEMERFKHRETELNEKIVLLEKDMKNMELENEMLTIMVEDLIKLQETHQEQVEEVKRFYDLKIEKLTRDHETMIQEVIESNQQEMTDFVKNYECLIKDLIDSHEQQIREWKLDFENDVKNVPELKDDKSAAGIPAKILQKFEVLSELQQGLIVIGVGILGTVIGMSSWRFIFWAWPKLVSFASKIELAHVINIIAFVNMFIESSGFKKFKEILNSGEPIKKEHILDLGSDSLGFAVTHLGPSLLSLGNGSRKANLSIQSSKSLGNLDKQQF